MFDIALIFDASGSDRGHGPGWFILNQYHRFNQEKSTNIKSYSLFIRLCFSSVLLSRSQKSGLASSSPAGNRADHDKCSLHISSVCCPISYITRKATCYANERRNILERLRVDSWFLYKGYRNFTQLEGSLSQLKAGVHGKDTLGQSVSCRAKHGLVELCVEKIKQEMWGTGRLVVPCTVWVGEWRCKNFTISYSCSVIVYVLKHKNIGIDFEFPYDWLSNREWFFYVVLPTSAANHVVCVRRTPCVEDGTIRVDHSTTRWSHINV